jgi:hypothetical protein
MTVMTGDVVYVLCAPQNGHGGNRFWTYVWAIKSVMIDGVNTFGTNAAGMVAADDGWLPEIADALTGWIPTAVFLPEPELEVVEQEAEVVVQEPDPLAEWFES